MRDWLGLGRQFWWVWNVGKDFKQYMGLVELGSGLQWECRVQGDVSGVIRLWCRVIGQIERMGRQMFYRWFQVCCWKVGNGQMIVVVVRVDQDGWMFQANLKKFMDYVQLYSTDKVVRLLDKGLDFNFYDFDLGGEQQSRKSMVLEWLGL